MADEINGVAPTEHAIFTFGTDEIKVPALSLWDLQETKPLFDEIETGMDWRLYAATVVKIVAFVKAGEDATAETRSALANVFMKKCTVEQTRQMSVQMNAWLKVSGFDMGEDLAAEASPGTGTLMPSSPNSQSEESVADIRN